MTINLLQAVWGGFLASIAWFIIGGIFYMNPLVSKIHKKFENSPAVKQWSNTKLFLIYMYLFILLECLLFAVVYSFIKPVFPGSAIINGLMLGLALVAVNLIPSISGRWILSTYPNKLLFVDFVGGILGSFIIGLIITFVI